MAGIFSDMEIDALREIGNIGSGNASAKISAIINERVDLNLTELNIIPITQMSESYGSKPEDIMVSIFLRVEGDAEGTMVFGSIVNLFQKELALRLTDLMSGNPIGTTKFIEERNQDKFYLLGKETSQAYLNALCEFMGVKLFAAAPILTVNTKATIMKFMARNLPSSNTDQVLRIRTKFSISKYGLEGEFLLVFGFESIDKFKELIKKKLESY